MPAALDNINTKTEGSRQGSRESTTTFGQYKDIGVGRRNFLSPKCGFNPNLLRNSMGQKDIFQLNELKNLYTIEHKPHLKDRSPGPQGRT